MSASSLKTLVAQSITAVPETMSSLQVVELINLERGLSPGNAELRHDHFMVKVPKVLGGGALSWKGSYRTSQNKQLPCYNLPPEEAQMMIDSYLGTLKHEYGAKEKIALNTIEQVLGIALLRQYNVGGYRIDGYDEENNIAYEIDEKQHRNPAHQAADAVRQQYIEQELGCTFVRVAV